MKYYQVALSEDEDKKLKDIFNVKSDGSLRIKIEEIIRAIARNEVKPIHNRGEK